MNIMADDKLLRDLPATDASTAQLFAMFRQIDGKLDDVVSEQEQAKAETAHLREELAGIKQEFNSAKMVFTVLKWLAGLGAAVAAIIGVFKSTT